MLRPSFGMIFGAWLFLGMGCLVVVAPILSAQGNVFWMSAGEMFGSFVGLLVVLIGLVLVFSPLRFEFDRDQGVLRRRRLFVFRKRNVDLRKFQGVQLLWERRKSSGSDDKTVRYENYFQVNLLVADPKRPRINLTVFADLLASERIAKEVAAFLEVPFFDQLPEGDLYTWKWETEGEAGSSSGSAHP